MVEGSIVMGLSCGMMGLDDVPADDGTIIGSTDACAAVCAVVAATSEDAMLSCCRSLLLMLLLILLSLSRRISMLLIRRCLMSLRLAVGR